jgi:hypothetical protein
LLQYLEDYSRSLLDSIVEHPAGRKTYAHARRFNNNESDLRGFWVRILESDRFHSSSYLEQVNRNVEYIKNNQGVFNDAFVELAAYVPPDYTFDCRLFLILGYDVGIVSEGDALLNVGHDHFSGNLREMVYYAMHELHHVCYTHYYPIFALSDIRTSKDLFDVVLYCAHMEGIAVYCSFDRRRCEHGLNDEDYRVLMNQEELILRVQEFFEILNELRASPLRPMSKSDYEILDIMSGRSKRLWYIAGANIAQTIDSYFGRKELIDTIVRGSKSYFAMYEKIPLNRRIP